MNKPFKISARARSFGYAFKGIAVLIRTQHNAWIHVLATVVVCGAGFYFRLGSDEWCWIVLAIAAVWGAEGLNTAIELLADAACPQEDPLVGKAKDVAAGAVLLAAVGAAIIGLLVFGPHLAALVR